MHEKLIKQHKKVSNQYENTEMKVKLHDAPSTTLKLSSYSMSTCSS